MAHHNLQINLQDVLGENAEYVDGDSAAAIEGLPSESWAALVEACEELTGGASEPGIDCEICKTFQPISDFDKGWGSLWNEGGKRSEFTFDGLPAVLYERFQISKGDQRRDQIIVDCGPCRAVLLS